MTSIVAAFGAGSGIDSTRLAGDLVAAARGPRQTAIDARATTNTARLSSVAALSNSLVTLADSARTRVRTLAEADIPTFVEDLVGAINEIRTQINGATRAQAGAAAPLSGDAGVRTLSRALSDFVGATTPGSTLRLTDIGVTTQRDGTLALDSAKLAAAIGAEPAAVKTLLGMGTIATSGIAARLQTLKIAMTSSTGALSQSRTIYGRAASAIGEARARLDTDMTRLSDRLTVSFSSMDRQVAAIKASQAYMAQQVALWTAQR